MGVASFLFEKFKVENLVTNVDDTEFKRFLMDKIDKVDFIAEGYSEEELENQRDLSIKFHWGHNHDFGSFKLNGRMGNRHLELFEKSLAFFPITLDSFSEKHILDVGCWTGGTTLLLGAVSKEVTAVEEVNKYASTTRYLTQSFGMNAQVIDSSLYALNDLKYYDSFDRIYFPGVIYHLSDPVLALRILFNCLSIGGDILIETAGFESDKALCSFEGNYAYHANGTREELNRGGWNYFMLSGHALERMMKEAGFVEIRYKWDKSSNRLFAYGTKEAQVGICKAGLSVPEIR
jgi:SAM-dependent methyltransferase